jgi:hypothetical protein
MVFDRFARDASEVIDLLDAPPARGGIPLGALQMVRGVLLQLKTPV